MGARISKTFHNRTEFHFGCGFNKAGQKIADSVGFKIADDVLALVAEEYGGGSLTHQLGAWRDDQDQTISEPGYTVVAYGTGDWRKIAEKILDLAKQTAVIVAIFDTDLFSDAWQMNAYEIRRD